MFGKSYPSGGTAMVVSVGASGASFAIVSGAHPQKLELATNAELPLESRSLEQTASTLKLLIAEQGAALINAYAPKGGARVSRVYLLVHAPLVSSFAVQSAKTFDSSVKITDAVLDELARNALGSLGAADEFMSATMLRVALNGYKTASPEGKRARSVELTGLVTKFDLTSKELLMSGINAFAPHANVQLRPGALALIGAAHASTGLNADNSLIVYLSADGTELVAMHDGVPSTCAYLPVGVRHIAQLAFPGRPASTVRAELRLSAKGNLSEESATHDESALVRIEGDLARTYGESLAKLSAVQRLPPAILLLAPYEISDWFGHFLERIDFAPFSMTAQPFIVSQVPIASFAPLLDASVKDVQLALAVSLFTAGQ